MPRLPTLDDLGARPVPVSRRGVASNPRAGAVGQALEGFGETASRIGQGMFEREDRLAYASAKASLLQADVAARQELEADPDFETWGTRYNERMAAARENAGKLIHSSRDRALFEADTKVDIVRGSAALGDIANARRRDGRIATLDEGLATFASVASSATDEPTRAAARAGASDLIRAAVDRGDITAVDAGNRGRKFVQDDIVGQVETMLLADDYDSAAAFLLRNGGQLEQDTRTTLARRIDEGLDNRLTLSRAEDAVHGSIAAATTTPEGTGPVIGGDRGEVAKVLGAAGFPAHVVAGFLGNFEVEGGYGGARGDGGSASGIAQWRNERRANFRRMFGKDPHNASKAEQAQFVVWEMQNPEAAGMTVAQRDAILAADSPEQAAALIDANYERSSGEHRARRQEAARGFHGGAAQGPMQHDLNDVYARIDARAKEEHWTPEETESVKAQASRIVDRDERLLARQRDEAADEAARVIAGLPGGLTDIAQIPRNVRERMDPTEVATLEQGIRERNEEAAEGARKDAQDRRATELAFMRRFEPEKFKRLNPLNEATRLSSTDFNTFMMNHMEANETEAFDPTGVRGGINSEISFQETHGGQTFNKKDKIKLFDVMEAQLSLIQSKKGRLESSDYADAYRTATRQAVSGGREIGARTFEVLSDVPEGVQAEIVRNWQGPQPPTPGQIIAAYTRLLHER